MTRRINPIPPLRFHAPTKQFCAYHLGQRITFGRDPAAADRAYRTWLSRLVAGPSSDAASAPAPPTVAEVLTDYVRYASKRYSGQHLNRIHEAIRLCTEAPLCDDGPMIGTSPASAFRAKMLLRVREHVARQTVRRPGPRFGKPISRSYVNGLIDCIQKAWRWLTVQELVPEVNLASVLAVKSLAPGEGGWETPRVRPAPLHAVEAAIAGAPPILKAMLQVQLFSSARPGEVCRMRRCDISTRPDERVLLPVDEYPVSAFDLGEVRLWVYVPRQHKTMWKGKPRILLLGPQAQVILAPFFLNRSAEAFLFSPTEATALRRAEQRASRRTPVQPSQIDRRKPAPRKTPRDRYDTDSYRRAIDSLVKKLNAERAAADPPGLPVPMFRPNQIRHLGLTETAEAFDEATAAAVAGHAGTDAIHHYVKNLIRKAGAAVAEMG